MNPVRQEIWSIKDTSNFGFVINVLDGFGQVVATMSNSSCTRPRSNQNNAFGLINSKISHQISQERTEDMSSVEVNSTAIGTP